MRAGAPIVYQGVFVDGRWHGVADFLVRVESPSSLGPWSYEAWDTKLARRSRPYFLLQLCFYSAQMARLQDRAPELMRVVLGDGRVDGYRFEDFAAYARRLWRRLESTGADLPETYPYPVPHCALCHHADACQATWEQDDHLSLVAGIRRDQVERLARVGIRHGRRPGGDVGEPSGHASAPPRWSACDTRPACSTRAVPPAGTSSICFRRKRAGASRCCHLRTTATCSSTWRATRTSSRLEDWNTCSEP